MSEQEEPLILRSGTDAALHEERGAANKALSAPEAEASPSVFVWLLTLSAGISGLLFGYDTGVISATLVSIGSALDARPLNSRDKSIITSSTALFALLASPVASLLADSLGRRGVLVVADLLFVAGALIQCMSTTVAAMTVGRAIVGAGVGAASLVVPLYIAELAPAGSRGRLVAVNNVLITLGQVAAYVVGWAFAEYAGADTGWRWMVGLGAVPAAVQVVMLVWMPDTPRWLVKAGRKKDARAVIARVAGQRNGRDTGALVAATVKDIEQDVREEEEARKLRNRRSTGCPTWTRAWLELMETRANRRALAVACLLQGLQQLCGFNSLMYFSATIFTTLGFTVPTLTSLVVSLTNFLFTIAALLLVDRLGRRRMLLSSLPLMVLGLVTAAYGFSVMNLRSTSGRTTTTTTTSATTAANTPPSTSTSAAVVILASFTLYVAAYASALGVVPWMQSELFALSVRSLGSGLATATNWGANFAVGLTFLPMMDALSPSWTFVLYAVVCTLGLGLVWRVYPETCGLSLEESAALLERDDWGVR